MVPVKAPLFTAILVGLVLSACGGGTPQAVPANAASPAGSAAGGNVVKFGANNTSLDSTLYFLMQSAGIYARHGLTVQLVPAAGAASLDSLIAGETDGIAIGGPQTVLLAIQNGAPLQLVAAPSHLYNIEIVTPNSITSLAQLKGKRAGAQSQTAINAQGMRRALDDAGLQAGRDYEFVVTGASGSAGGVLAALVANQIEAAPLDDFNARKAAQQGNFHVLLDLASPEAHIDAAFSVVTFRKAFIQQHPDLVQKMIDSIVDGVRYMREHKPETIAALKSRAGLDDPALLEATYDRQLHLLAKAPSISKDFLADAVRYVPKGAPPLTDELVAGALEPRFVDDAVRRGLANY
jgi:ABC-type nitrate/sulfonate/bicarbonate transport system substrate-binding protein